MGAKRLVFLSAFLALSWYTANADPIVTSPTVALGTDYFQTQPGTFFNFGPGIGIVNFVGLPIGPLSTGSSMESSTTFLSRWTRRTWPRIRGP